MKRASIHRRGAAIFAALASLAAFASCGGKVFVDTPGEAGGNGGSGNPSGGDPATKCAAFCQATAQAGCGSVNECVSQCESAASLLGPCEDEFLAYTDCVVQNIGLVQNCAFPSNLCQGEIAALGICAGANTTGGGFGGGF